jgi:hypothetical protein
MPTVNLQRYFRDYDNYCFAFCLLFIFIVKFGIYRSFEQFNIQVADRKDNCALVADQENKGLVDIKDFPTYDPRFLNKR